MHRPPSAASLTAGDRRVCVSVCVFVSIQGVGLKDLTHTCVSVGVHILVVMLVCIWMLEMSNVSWLSDGPKV